MPHERNSFISVNGNWAAVTLPRGNAGPRLFLSADSRLTGRLGGQRAAGAAVFLDRDGVLIEDTHFLTSLEQMRLLPGVTPALRALQERYYLIVATNQSGVARGLFTEQDVAEAHAELARRLAVESVVLDAVYYCPHLPEAAVPEYALVCECRKPKAGMLLEAARALGIDLRRSFMVGDAPRDTAAGSAAGLTSILVGRTSAPVDGARAEADLAHAARFILESADRSAQAH